MHCNHQGLPLNRTNEELENPHPVFKAFTEIQVARGFQNTETWDATSSLNQPHFRSISLTKRPIFCNSRRLPGRQLSIVMRTSSAGAWEASVTMMNKMLSYVSLKRSARKAKSISGLWGMAESWSRKALARYVSALFYRGRGSRARNRGVRILKFFPLNQKLKEFTNWRKKPFDHRAFLSN